MKVKVDSTNASVDADYFDAKIGGVGALYNNETKTITCKYGKHELRLDTKTEQTSLDEDKIDFDIKIWGLMLILVMIVWHMILFESKAVTVQALGNEIQVTQDRFYLNVDTVKRIIVQTRWNNCSKHR